MEILQILWGEVIIPISFEKIEVNNMATFNTKQVLYGSSLLIPKIAEQIQMEFAKDGYETAIDKLSSGGFLISVTKGGLFKAVMGMKTALKISLLPQDSNIYFEAGVGIWGQQAIPTVISMLFFWPVLITQIWGLIQQSKLDDRALEIAQSVISFNSAAAADTGSGSFKFCTKCGAKNIETAKFCMECGKPL